MSIHRYSWVVMTKILSPYGKNVTAELNDVYNLASVKELLSRVRHFLETAYGFGTVQIEEVHVAFGVAIRFAYADESYYLKFTGRANHGDPEELFRYLEYLRTEGVPLPKIVETIHGTWFENILDNSPYDVTYVMKTLPGKPPARKTVWGLESYLNVMAEFHRLGATYKPIYARSRDVHRCFQEAREDLESANGFSSDQRELLRNVIT